MPADELQAFLVVELCIFDSAVLEEPYQLFRPSSANLFQVGTMPPLLVVTCTAKVWAYADPCPPILNDLALRHLCCADHSHGAQYWCTRKASSMRFFDAYAILDEDDACPFAIDYRLYKLRVVCEIWERFRRHYYIVICLLRGFLDGAVDTMGVEVVVAVCMRLHLEATGLDGIVVGAAYDRDEHSTG